MVEVRNAQGKFLCYALFNRKAYITARAIAFDHGDPLASIRKAMERAVALRTFLFGNEDTNAYRLINAEGDDIPGLVVDKYGDILVLRLTILGMDKLRSFLAETLMELCHPRGIYEKSTGHSRSKEGLRLEEGWLAGEGSTRFTVRERGLQFSVELAGSQKTGLFLDQREMRSLVRSFAKGRTVLDCCSYVGGFSLAALSGGALAADAVDYDEKALRDAKNNMELNSLRAASFSTYQEDVFNFLRRKPLPQPYDFIILDPPSFAKRSADVEHAKGAYTDLNRLAFEALPKGSLLLTCSCSYHIDESLFRTIIFHASRQANRSVRILSRHREASDHPMNICHPETEYLKSLLL
jgi:23S rRNA (cytosine1962-C5)-methyltransferase